MTALPQVDHTAIRTNQAFIIGLNLLAFILDLPVLVGVTGLVMLRPSTPGISSPSRQ